MGVDEARSSPDPARTPRDGHHNDVRIWRTEIYRGARTTSYYVRWRVGTKPWKEPFRTKALAVAFRADLVAAASKGEAFSITTPPDIDGSCCPH